VRVFRYYFLQWLILTTVAGAFFTIAPRMFDGRNGSYPTILIAILFPAIVIGLFSAFHYLAHRR